MSISHKTLFISDLHLSDKEPHIVALFSMLLTQCDHTVDALYILGDLFEAWIGDDDLTPFHQTIIQVLRSTADRGINIYFLHGNRDFLIGKDFLKKTGCIAIAEEEKINMYGTPVLAMHGDTLCTADLSYLKMRKFFHHRLVQFLFLLLPIKWRRKIADNMRSNSEHHTKYLSMEKMDVTQSAVLAVMQKHHVNFLIHGHTHQPAFHTIDAGEIQGMRIVLGAWHERGNLLVWHDNGEKEWIEFSHQSAKGL